MSNSSSPSAAAAGIGGGASSAGSCSTSIITEAGSHVLRVECYSATKRLGVGKFIELNAFIVGGLSWVFRYYPNGDNKGSTNWIAVDVFCLDSKDEIVNARFKFFLLARQGRRASSTILRREEHQGSWFTLVRFEE